MLNSLNSVDLVRKPQEVKPLLQNAEIDDDFSLLDQIDNILDLDENRYPRFTLAKNKARFLRMLSWYKNKEEWLDVAPLSGVNKLFKQQTKELKAFAQTKLVS